MKNLKATNKKKKGLGQMGKLFGNFGLQHCGYPFFELG
jgi:hypothetical protein